MKLSPLTVLLILSLSGPLALSTEAASPFEDSAPQKPDSFFITVGSVAPNRETDRARCVKIQNALSATLRIPVSARCATTQQAQEIQAARLLNRYQFHVSEEFLADGSVRLSIENWNPADLADPTEVPGHHLRCLGQKGA